jgi:hypothetical protein
MHMPGELQTAHSTIDSYRTTALSSGKNFWATFRQDLKLCASSLTIVSPLLTNDATWNIANELKDLRSRNVIVKVYTRPLDEHQNRYGFNLAYARLKKLGAEVITVSKIQQKLAVIDEIIWWEGSLNILGFRDSPEQMSRFQGPGAKSLLAQLQVE